MLFLHLHTRVDLNFDDFSTRFCLHDIKFRLVNGFNVQLKILGYKTLPDNTFKAVPMATFVEFSANDRVVQRYGQSIDKGNPIFPCPHELCVVKMAGQWYRCEFLESYGQSRAKVYSFDYGIIFDCSEWDIRVNIFILLLL